MTTDVPPPPLAAEVDIATAAERVWAILCDVAGYPSWNPVVRIVEGRSCRWGRLILKLTPPGVTPVTLQLHRRRLRKPHTIEATAHLLAPGLCSGDVVLTVVSVDQDHCRVIAETRLRGALAGAFGDELTAACTAGFEAMTEALRQTAEAKGGAAPL